MKKIIPAIAFAAILASCNGTGSSAKVVDKLQNDDQKAGYAYGMNVANQVKMFAEQQTGDDKIDYKELERGLRDYLKLDPKVRTSYGTGQNIGMSIENFIKQYKLEGIVSEDFIVQGLMDNLNGKETLFPADSINQFMAKYIQDSSEKLKTRNLDESKSFLEKTKQAKGVKATDSGLLYEVMKEGDGAMPVDGSVVEVNYVGKTTDGNIFDQSKEGEPVKFNLNGVIKGWQEGLKLMKVGSKYKFYIPSELAYGEAGTPDGSIGPNQTLIFEVELLSSEDAPKMDNLPQIPSPDGN